MPTNRGYSLPFRNARSNCSESLPVWLLAERHYFASRHAKVHPEPSRSMQKHGSVSSWSSIGSSFCNGLGRSRSTRVSWFSQAQSHEVVLQAGQVIISLDVNMQCITGSGIDHNCKSHWWLWVLKYKMNEIGTFILFFTKLLVINKLLYNGNNIRFSEWTDCSYICFSEVIKLESWN